VMFLISRMGSLIFRPPFGIRTPSAEEGADGRAADALRAFHARFLL